MRLRKLFFLIGAMILGGCASKQTTEPYVTRLYTGSYEEVWLATLKALNDYPLKLTAKDSGRLQSEVVNGPYNELLFTYPDALELPERFRYSLRLNLAKFQSDDRDQVVRVRIVKDLEKFYDFYTGWVAYPSDGLEEKLLLYRVEHILQMERHLSKQPAE